MLKVISVCSNPEHATTLINSLTKHGWDWVLLHVEFKGFGTKLVSTYEYLKKHPEVTEFIFVDAFDVVALGGEEEFKEKLKDFPSHEIIFNCEKGLWPPSIIPFRNHYPNLKHGFNYLNSGVYYAKSEYFIRLFEYFPPFLEIDDQLYFHICMMHSPAFMFVDHHQQLFNCHSFINEGEYTYNNGRVQILGHEPIFIHSNGKTVDEKLNELLKNDDRTS